MSLVLYRATDICTFVDPKHRRFSFPFTSTTRYSIIAKAAIHRQLSSLYNKQHRITCLMDHLCPRLSFPLAPCLSCLSQTTPPPTTTAPLHLQVRRPSLTHILSALTAARTSTATSAPKAYAASRPSTPRSPLSPLDPTLAYLAPTEDQSTELEATAATKSSKTMKHHHQCRRPSTLPFAAAFHRRSDSATLPSLDHLVQTR